MNDRGRGKLGDRGRTAGVRVVRAAMMLVSALLVAASPRAGSPGAAPPEGPSAPAAVAALSQADNVAVLTIDGAITRVTTISIRRRLMEAAAGGADGVVIEIDSPGGEVGAVLEICADIKALRDGGGSFPRAIPNVVAWVNDQAYSGGAVVAVACREIVTASTAQFGDAFVIRINPLTGELVPMTPEERTKQLPPLLGEVVDSARRSGYDEFFVQTLVTDGIELWAVEDTLTGRTLAIDEAEYRLLFEGEPDRSSPWVPSVTGALRAAPGGQGGAASAEDREGAGGLDSTTDEAEAGGEPQAGQGLIDTGPGDVPDNGPDDGLENGPQTGPDAGASGAIGGAARSGADPGASSAADDDPLAFEPAAPWLEALTRETTPALTEGTTRPRITAADRGRYVYLGYVTDGTAAAVVQPPLMERFGLSNAVVNNDSELLAYFGATRLARLNRSVAEHVAAFMSQIWVKGLLIVVVLVGVFIELLSPGAIIPASAAGAALLGLLAPALLLDMAGWWEIVAIGLGLTLFAVELFVLPGMGVFGALGVVLLFVGLVGTFIPDSSGGLFGDDSGLPPGLLRGVTTVLLSVATSGVAMYVISRNFGSLPLFSRLVLASGGPEEREDGGGVAAAGGEAADDAAGLSRLVGATGVALSPLRPSGRAEVAGEAVDALSALGFIPAGEAVRVVGVRGYSVVVEPAEGGGASA